RQIRSRLLAATEISPNEVVFLPLERMLERLGMETEMKERRFVDRRPRVERPAPMRASPSIPEGRIAVVVGGVRTPFAKSGGRLKSCLASELAAVAMREALAPGPGGAAAAAAARVGW